MVLIVCGCKCRDFFLISNTFKQLFSWTKSLISKDIKFFIEAPFSRVKYRYNDSFVMDESTILFISLCRGSSFLSMFLCSFIDFIKFASKLFHTMINIIRNYKCSVDTTVSRIFLLLRFQGLPLSVKCSPHHVLVQSWQTLKSKPRKPTNKVPTVNISKYMNCQSSYRCIRP